MKKNEKPFERLNQKRQLFLFIGMCISLSLVISAFQLKRPPIEPVELFGIYEDPIEISHDNIQIRIVEPN